MKLTFLYRGPLSSCNYGCEYCPFAKREESDAELARDEAALARFVEWIAARPADDRLRVFFTPWGEALVRPWYRDALARLTTMPQVEKAAIQTNLSAPLSFLDRCDPLKLGVWATYHPEWTTRAKFLAAVERLRARGVSTSVGVVGFRRFREEARALRAALPGDVYLWVNAVKRSGGPEPYSADDIAFFESLDPLFRVNLVDHPSLGRGCRTGADVVSVDGDGTLRRCHFVAEKIGNLYDDSFASAFRERPCPNDTCGCHIGYAHLDELELGAWFGAGLLERAPEAPLRVLT